MPFIYKITNLINNKVYIGKTSYSTIEERFKEHIKDSKKERCEKRPLYDAFNKYGVENFIVKEVEWVENDIIACEREQYWIKYYRAYIGFNDCNGYNATLGGDSRRLYDYKEIANKYQELKNIEKTAAFFGCDKQVVKNACEENQIKTLSSAEMGAKKVAKLDKDTLEVIQIYDSIAEAFKDLGKKRNGSIYDVCTGRHKTYLGYAWKYV